MRGCVWGLGTCFGFVCDGFGLVQDGFGFASDGFLGCGFGFWIRGQLGFAGRRVRFFGSMGCAVTWGAGFWGLGGCLGIVRSDLELIWGLVGVVLDWVYACMCMCVCVCVCVCACVR